LFEQLADHRADPQHLRGLLDDLSFTARTALGRLWDLGVALYHDELRLVASGVVGHICHHGSPKRVFEILRSGAPWGRMAWARSLSALANRPGWGLAEDAARVRDRLDAEVGGRLGDGDHGLEASAGRTSQPAEGFGRAAPDDHPAGHRSGTV